MNLVSLFTGIGGIELGLERAGMTTIAQVESDPYCQQVLARHWPEVPRHDDVRSFPAWWALEPRPPVDVVCGGFPCQPFSSGGLGRGVADERWGWPWMAEAIRATRPKYVVVENVAELLRHSDAFGWVLRDLASVGLDATWDVLPASSVGALHRRRRLVLVAHPSGDDVPGQSAAEAQASRWDQPRGGGLSPDGRARWLPEPTVDRVAHGLPRRVVSPALHALGNAVVPPLFEHVGRLIVQHARVRYPPAASEGERDA